MKKIIANTKLTIITTILISAKKGMDKSFDPAKKIIA
tara:strand:+ start:1368 stop:1478 length:111 start_codon:yes stop_codon:yes gene_type:complete